MPALVATRPDHQPTQAAAYQCYWAVPLGHQSTRQNVSFVNGVLDTKTNRQRPNAAAGGRDRD